jgi:hypothetical protein
MKSSTGVEPRIKSKVLSLLSLFLAVAIPNLTFLFCREIGLSRSKIADSLTEPEIEFRSQ